MHVQIKNLEKVQEKQPKEIREKKQKQGGKTFTKKMKNNSNNSS